MFFNKILNGNVPIYLRLMMKIYEEQTCASDGAMYLIFMSLGDFKPMREFWCSPLYKISLLQVMKFHKLEDLWYFSGLECCKR